MVCMRKPIAEPNPGPACHGVLFPTSDQQNGCSQMHMPEMISALGVGIILGTASSPPAVWQESILIECVIPYGVGYEAGKNPQTLPSKIFLVLSLCFHLWLVASPSLCLSASLPFVLSSV